MLQSWLLTGWTNVRLCCQHPIREMSLPQPRRTCKKAAQELNSHLRIQPSPVQEQAVFLSSTVACANRSSTWMVNFTSMWLSAQFVMKLRRRIINLGPIMLISEEQPAQPALPVQPEGTRVVCGHCGNTFLWMELRFNTLAKCPHCKKISSVGSALPRRRCCAYVTIGMICIFIGVGLTVGTQDFSRRFHATYVSWAIAYLLGLICLIRACYWGAIRVSYPEHGFA